jgi:hypothetical protein
MSALRSGKMARNSQLATVYPAARLKWWRKVLTDGAPLKELRISGSSE